MPTIASMVLKEVLPDYGCPSLMDLARGIGVRKQYAWLLWHGKIALSLDMARRIHTAFKVPVEVLMQITRATQPKRRGRKPTQPAPDEDRSDRFAWTEDDEVTLQDPEAEAPA